MWDSGKTSIRENLCKKKSRAGAFSSRYHALSGGVVGRQVVGEAVGSVTPTCCLAARGGGPLAALSALCGAPLSAHSRTRAPRSRAFRQSSACVWARARDVTRVSVSCDVTVCDVWPWSLDNAHHGLDTLNRLRWVHCCVGPVRIVCWQIGDFAVKSVNTYLINTGYPWP